MEVAMFVQVVEGSISDAEAFGRQLDVWSSDLKAGASGYLGSTGGVADDGRAILIARFESPETAKANSDRPEQGRWWATTELLFDGPATFAESTDVDVYMAGGSDEAGFVQIMKGSTGDRERLMAMDEKFAPHVEELWPALIGGARIWTGSQSYIEAAYFTSEAAAREAEQKEPPDHLTDLFTEHELLMANVEFMDLRAPLFSSP